MKLAMIGTGYVGLVTGTCFAETGNDVVCVDVDQRKVETLRAGKLPIYEPGLKELVERNTQLGRLEFTTDFRSAVKRSEIVFIAVGTPQGNDGAADLSNIWAVADAIADAMDGPKVIVTKSTVPVGTAAAIEKRLAGRAKYPFDCASNPEFLKEGAAIDDFTRPDRVVVGVRRPEVAEVLRTLYAPFLRTEHPFLVMSPESAEMTKYVANAMLATKISFINEMANLCECMGADVNDVRRGIGHDARIGFSFLFPGAGYGGSCFPKDVRALIAMARAHGVPPRLLTAVDEVNESQKNVLWGKINSHFGGRLAGKTIAVWGLAFKPRTDDVREAPALVLLQSLLSAGARVQVHDPVAMANVRAQFGERLTYCDRQYDALREADALAIVTEWNEFRNPDFDQMRRLMRSPVVFDGRNLYEPDRLARLGFHYFPIGRPTRSPDSPRRVGQQ
jgi:UDPglucose 6-dehydrogenase